MNTAISQAVEEGNLYDIEDMVNAALAAGESPKELLEALMAGIKACGDRFETGEFFLPELLGSGEAFKAGLGILAPKRSAGDQVSQGKVGLGMEDVIKELKKQGLRDKVKVIIGGGPVSKKYADDIGADAYGNDAAQAVRLVRSLL